MRTLKRISEAIHKLLTEITISNRLPSAQPDQPPTISRLWSSKLTIDISLCCAILHSQQPKHWRCTMYILRIIALFTIPLGLAACGAPAPQTKAPATSSMTVVAAPKAAPAPTPVAATPTAVRVSDGVYTGNIGGKTATLTISGGQPVAYNWGSYNGKRFALDGNVIKIDAATLTIASASSNRIDGRWVLRGRGSNVTFTK